MSEKLYHNGKEIEEAVKIGSELTLLKSDPHGFAQEFDGRLPLAAPYLGIRTDCFVVDEQTLDASKWQFIHGMFIPLKIVDNNSISTLQTKFEYDRLREQLGPGIIFAATSTKDNYPNNYLYKFTVGAMFPADLGKDIKTLTNEAITAKKKWGHIGSVKASAKVRAIFAQLLYFERNSAPDWDDIFLK